MTQFEQGPFTNVISSFVKKGKKIAKITILSRMEPGGGAGKKTTTFTSTLMITRQKAAPASLKNFKKPQKDLRRSSTVPNHLHVIILTITINHRNP